KKIKLPTAVMESVEYKVTQKHLVEAHELLIRKEEKEARRKRLEGEGIRDQLTIIASALPEGEIMRWLGVNATLELARSDNAKVVVIGSPETGFPIIGNVHMTDLNASGPTEERAASDASNR
ncbi:MAG: prohibitin family protein, partial [Desulfobacterales bacterium]|nr:prohibitin family protein [Desulfobacterales bacterium]